MTCWSNLTRPWHFQPYIHPYFRAFQTNEPTVVMRSFSAVVVLTASLLSNLAVNGQLSFGGHPKGMDRQAGLPEAPTVVMPAVDVETLKAEDEVRALSPVKGPYRFGFNHMVDLGLENSGIWHTLPNDDRVWRLSIKCPEAYSINFEFHEYVIPEGAQVFVYNDLDEVIGGFEAGSNPGHDQLGVTQLAGDRITIEYVEPVAVRGQGRLRVGQVTHAYRDILGTTKALNESGSCNNNVICPEGDPWRAQIRSVAMITVNGNGACTGQLINNCANDGHPYFLTANHCLGGNNWVFRFNWNSPTCATTTNGPMNQSVAGFTLLANSAGSDVALLELNTNPPPIYNVFYSGWNKAATAATSVTCIHHPSGDIKKISFEEQAVTSGTFDGAQCWKVSAWDDGTTEGGSSGSGLWNQNGLLVGQLFGGSASCDFNFNDFFGKFSVSYPLLSEWLGTCGDQLQGYPLTSTDISEAQSTGTIALVPNPTNGSVVVTLPAAKSGTTDLRVMDAIGRTIVQQTIVAGTERITLDMTGHREGLYFVEATSAGVRMVERLVLTR